MSPRHNACDHYGHSYLQALWKHAVCRPHKTVASTVHASGARAQSNNTSLRSFDVGGVHGCRWLLVKLLHCTMRFESTAKVLAGASPSTTESQSALLTCMAAGGWSIERARISLGGVGPFTQLAPQAAQAMQQQPWSRATLDRTLAALSKDVNQVSGTQGLSLGSLRQPKLYQTCACNLRLQCRSLCNNACTKPDKTINAACALCCD